MHDQIMLAQVVKDTLSATEIDTAYLSTPTSVATDSFVGVAAETVYVNMLSVSDMAYMEILEKTNQQLSLWWNPYGLMIAAMGTLFAVMAIFTAVVIWRQGSGYRRILDKAILDHNQVLEQLQDEKFVAIEKAMGERIAALKSKEDEGAENTVSIKEELKALRSERKAFEKFRKKVEKQRESEVRPWIGLDPSLISGATYQVHPFTDSAHTGYTSYIGNARKCASCGNMFTPPISFGSTVVFDEDTVKCPQCGNVERR